MAAFNDTFIQAGTVRLHAVEAGDRQKPLVVFLHGFPELWWSWRAQLEAVAAAGYFGVAIDQRGYNTSDKPAGVGAYDLDLLADDVAAVVRHYGQARAVIVGHDWGGAVAWHFAQRHPELLERLIVLNCPHPQRMLEGLRTFRQLKKSWYMFLFQAPLLPEWYLRRNDYAMIRRAFGRAVSADDMRHYVDAAREGGLTGAVNYYRAAARRLLKQGGLGKSSRIHRPVRLIWGELDRFLGRELAEVRAELVADFQVEYIATAGHWVQASAPAEVNALLLRFLRE